MKVGHKPKLTPLQIKHARKLIDDGGAAQDVAALLNVDRTTLCRALASWCQTTEPTLVAKPFSDKLRVFRAQPFTRCCLRPALGLSVFYRLGWGSHVP